MISRQKTSLIIDLTPKFMEGARSYPKKLGRYSCSQLHKMLEAARLPWGLPPEKYFEPEEITFEGAMRMIKGVQAHDLVQKYLDPSKVEKKFEYYYYGDGDYRNGTVKATDEEGNLEEPIFTVVGKVDYLPEDCVWEIKSSETEFTKSKDYHDHQAKLYCTICERPKAIILQPLEDDSRFFLKQIGEVIRDDEWFEAEMRRLHNYHQRLEIIMKENARLHGE